LEVPSKNIDAVCNLDFLLSQYFLPPGWSENVFCSKILLYFSTRFSVACTVEKREKFSRSGIDSTGPSLTQLCHSDVFKYTAVIATLSAKHCYRTELYCECIFSIL